MLCTYIFCFRGRCFDLGIQIMHRWSFCMDRKSILYDALSTQWTIWLWLWLCPQLTYRPAADAALPFFRRDDFQPPPAGRRSASRRGAGHEKVIWLGEVVFFLDRNRTYIGNMLRIVWSMNPPVETFQIQNSQITSRPLYLCRGLHWTSLLQSLTFLQPDSQNTISSPWDRRVPKCIGRSSLGATGHFECSRRRFWTPHNSLIPGRVGSGATVASVSSFWLRHANKAVTTPVRARITGGSGPGILARSVVTSEMTINAVAGHDVGSDWQCYLESPRSDLSIPGSRQPAWIYL